VIAIAGGLGDDVAALQAHGVDASFSVVRRPCSLEEALAAAADNLRAAARNIAEVLRIGGGLPAGRSEADGRAYALSVPAPVHPWAGGRAGRIARSAICLRLRKSLSGPQLLHSTLRPCEHGLPEAMGGNILPGFRWGSGAGGSFCFDGSCLWRFQTLAWSRRLLILTNSRLC
jgi:hypothetical protein